MSDGYRETPPPPARPGLGRWRVALGLFVLTLLSTFSVKAAFTFAARGSASAA